MKHFLLLLFVLVSGLFSFAQTYWPHAPTPYPKCNTMPTNCTKVAIGGDWNNANSWNPTGVPTADQIVCIPAGITINVSGIVTTQRLQIFVCGILDFDFNAPGKLNLAEWSFIQVYTGGLINSRAGNAELISIGGIDVWRDNNSDINGPWVLSYPYIGAGVLPVAFGHFKAEQKQPFTVNLEWSTLQEVNNSNFVIERSKDQKTWSTIGSVASAGNSTTKNVYTYIDNAPEAGNNFYRLRQVDLNGQVSFSETVRIVHIIKKNISIFPNPVNAAAQLYTKEAFKPSQVIQLIDAKGTRLKTINPTGGNRVQIEMNGLAAGLYLIQLMENGRIIESVSVIKQ